MGGFAGRAEAGAAHTRGGGIADAEVRESKEPDMVGGDGLEPPTLSV